MQRARKIFAPTQRRKKFFIGRIDVARGAMHSSFRCSKSKVEVSLGEG